jgi:carnitine 3-dehydrogenase
MPEVQRAATVGTGTIGASWATQLLVSGLYVIATDPGTGAEGALRAAVQRARPAAAAIRLAPGASPDRLTFTTDPREAVADADLVQENAPERAGLKIALFEQIDQAAPPSAILASSSSSITMSVIQSKCQHPSAA